jgi:hypothetical protein
MQILDDILMLIVAVASVVTIYYRVRGGSFGSQNLPRGLSRFLATLIALCVVVLFVAHRLFGILPAWPFHASLAGALTVFAVASYLDYKRKPTIMRCRFDLSARLKTCSRLKALSEPKGSERAGSHGK